MPFPARTNDMDCSSRTYRQRIQDILLCLTPRPGLSRRIPSTEVEADEDYPSQGAIASNHAASQIIVDLHDLQYTQHPHPCPVPSQTMSASPSASVDLSESSRSSLPRIILRLIPRLGLTRFIERTEVLDGVLVRTWAVPQEVQVLISASERMLLNRPSMIEHMIDPDDRTQCRI